MPSVLEVALKVEADPLDIAVVGEGGWKGAVEDCSEASGGVSNVEGDDAGGVGRVAAIDLDENHRATFALAVEGEKLAFGREGFFFGERRGRRVAAGADKGRTAGAQCLGGTGSFELGEPTDRQAAGVRWPLRLIAISICRNGGGWEPGGEPILPLKLIAIGASP
jgi:hypothetical protein